MKRFSAFVFVVFVVFSVLIINISTLKSLQQKNITDDSYTEEAFSSNEFCTFFNQVLTQRLFPVSIKYLSDSFFTERLAKLLTANLISDYTHISQWLIKRFSGYDIVYPFNYFW